MRQVNVGQMVAGRRVVETGIAYDYRDEDAHVLPVKFEDGSYAIISWNGNEFPKEWKPDGQPEAEKALSTSIQMPTVAHGIGSGAIHVKGVDKSGPFFIKLTYGWRAMEHGDEFYRPRK